MGAGVHQSGGGKANYISRGGGRRGRGGGVTEGTKKEDSQDGAPEENKSSKFN